MKNKSVFFLLITFILNSCSQTIERQRHQSFNLRNLRSNPRKIGDCLFNICEHIPNYPEQNVKEIIENNQDLHSYFGNVIEPSNPVMVEDRFGGTDYEPFCKTVDITVLPKFMKDVDDVERAIANVGKYQQVVKFQTCDFSQGEQCFAGSLLGRKTKCVQKFHVIKLLTVNVNNSTLEYRDFNVPTTCVCTYLF